MRQIGNLSVICAKRRDTLFQALNGKVSVHIGYGPGRKTLSADWSDDKKINEIIMELNHGKFREENMDDDLKSA